jgi:formate--tetrahydrofolate ligase
MPSDLEIARRARLRPIGEIASEIGLSSDQYAPYGHDKAKLALSLLDREPTRAPGRLVLVTAVTPTPAGEGKTTTTVGLAQGLNRLGVRAIPALREPSLGPVFGVKGGAAGGGHAQVVPMEDINLHFTGDLHAIGAANNLIAALVDNHLQSGNTTGLDPRRVTWRRCVDMNDRALRHIVTGLGGRSEGVPRETGFDITAASEVMAIVCLSDSLADLNQRLERIVVGRDGDDNPVRLGDIGGSGAATALLRDALRPNLVQTLEGGPALIHGGPFANIAHGCSSVLATRMALQLGEVCVTEAGFGADLGAEKFFNIKARTAGLAPDATVLVATVRAMRWHGGATKETLSQPNPTAVEKGCANLERHLENLRQFGVPIVVCINRFLGDTDAEIAVLKDRCAALGVESAVSDAWELGGAGAEELAGKVMETLEHAPSNFVPLYELGKGIKEKISTIATRLYRADSVEYSADALRSIRWAERRGFREYPVCIAKTQYSFSDNPDLRGAPTGHVLNIRDVRVSAGAGFVVASAGAIMTMPGLPAVPAAFGMSCGADGTLDGLS